jgi:D-3-phosphoglycerate dehydrogenase
MKLKKINVVVSDYIEENLDWEEEQLRNLPVDFKAYQLKNASFEELTAKVADAEILIVNMVPIDKKTLSVMKKCKLIIRHGTGYDNIDVQAATDYGLQVSYVPDYCQEEVAEQAMMLLLVAFRKFTSQVETFHKSVNKGVWDFSDVGQLIRLSGKSAGIIGCGRIGSKMLKMLQGFNIDVLVCDPYLTEKRQAELQIKCLPLIEVVSNVDMLTLHCTYTEETHHLIDENMLQKMKKETIVVNTSRGQIVDKMALARACREGWIAGAAIDVYGKEPPGKDFELIGLENVILTPHLSWCSMESGWSIREKIIEDINRYIIGKKPRFPVN